MLPLLRLRRFLPPFVAVCALALSACDDGAELVDEDESIAGFEASALDWQLRWDASSVDASEGGWTTVSDLGYELRIEGAWIGNWGATLIQCPETQTEGASAIELESSLGVASSGLVAEGHASGEDDPSAIIFDRVESLTALADVDIEGRELDSPVRYCEAHFVLASISSYSAGFDEAATELEALGVDAELDGASLLIVGQWRAPDAEDFEPFVLRSDRAYGRFVELEPGEALDDEDAVSTISIERGLEGLFDGIEFVDTEPEDAAWSVLRQLAQTASISHS